MLNFEREVIITGIERKTNTEKGTSYILIHVLGDEGVTISPIYKGDENKVFDVKKMEKYYCSFSFVGGKYPRLEILDIKVK